MEAQLPDGTVLEFPDGTSKEVIQKVVRARLGVTGTPGATPAQKTALAPSEGPSQPFERAGGYGPIMAGVADAGIKGYLGVKQLFGGLDKDEQGVLRMQKEEEQADPNGFTRGAGNVLANVAATAIPGAKGAGVLTKALAGAPRVLAPALTAAGVSGVQGALLDPGEGETFGAQMLDKGKQAGVDTLAGGAFGAGGQLLKKALTKPFTPSAEAKRLMDMDITPTLQQGAEGKVGRFIGGLTSAISDPRKRQNEEVLAEYLRRTAPGVVPPKATNAETLGMLDVYFDKGFRSLEDGKKFTLGKQDRGQIWRDARSAQQPDAQEMGLRAMGNTGSAFQTNNPVRMGADKMREYRQLLQDQINDLSGDDTMTRQAKAAMIKAKDRFDTLVRDPQMTPDELTKLTDLNGRYAYLLRYQDAASKASTKKEMKAGDLLQAFSEADKSGYKFARDADPMLREVLEPSARVMGLQPTQNEARALTTALTRIGKGTAQATGAAAAGTLAPMLAAPLYATSLLGQTKQGARVLMGETETQKKLADLLRQGAPYMAGAGQSLTGE